MSTFHPAMKTCAVCSQPSQHWQLCSTNSFGSPDLDLRPAPMKRNTMNMWLEECPHCGYVSSDIQEETEVTPQRLQETDYTTCDSRSFRAPLASRFYRAWKLAPYSGMSPERALRCAAWACDDMFDKPNAIFCRQKAAAYVKELYMQALDEQLLVLHADLLRRSGGFADVVEAYESHRMQDDMLNKLLAFEVEKSRAKDDACYTVADALK